MLVRMKSKLKRAKDLYDENGFVVIDDFLSPEQVEYLRRECDVLVSTAAPDAAVAVHGCIFEVMQGVHGANCMEECHSLALNDFKSRRSAWPLAPQVTDLITSKMLTSLIKVFLDCEDIYYFNEQYIVKPAMSTGSSFKWHRDSDWCAGDSNVEYNKYLSLWCPLDDVSEENGTLYTKRSNQSDEEEGEGGVPIIANAGACVIMSDRAVHSSSCNLSDEQRRVWMPQFSEGRIAWRETGRPVSFAIKL